MTISKWIVKNVGIQPNYVDGKVTQVYLVAQLFEQIFKAEHSSNSEIVYKPGDEVALHLRNVILNELGITDLNVFSKKYCKDISENMPVYFVISEDDSNDFRLDNVEDLKTAVIRSNKNK